MAMSAAEAYVVRIDAVQAQQLRLYGEPPPQRDRWGGRVAQRFREDPHRELSTNLSAIAAYVQTEDVVIDIGGGAGRVSLPLALSCREVINVDPSPGMAAEFEACAAEAGITNSRCIQSDWLAADGVQGDVSVVANVTYFVRDIVLFIQKLEAASRRRVLITVWSVPPPNRTPAPFRLVFEEDLEPAPGHWELLPVLWDMGILPDLRVLTGSFSPPEDRLPQTREEAVEQTLQRVAPPWALERRGPEFPQRARGLLDAHLEDFMVHTADGFSYLQDRDARELLITWETDRKR